jgi:hypothetical protein
MFTIETIFLLYTAYKDLNSSTIQILEAYKQYYGHRIYEWALLTILCMVGRLLYRVYHHP